MEGLGEVVVRAHLEAHDPVHVLAARRENDHRQAALAAQLATEREPVDPRHHQVEHEQVHRPLLERAQELAAVGKR